MSLVNAVHTLIEVAAGRLNLTSDSADELHAAIDREQDPMIADAPPAPAPPSEPTIGPEQTVTVPVPGTFTVGA